MTHDIIIWSRGKEKKDLRLETHLMINESDLLEMALKKYEDDYGITGSREYTADLDKTTHLNC